MKLDERLLGIAPASEKDDDEVKLSIPESTKLSTAIKKAIKVEVAKSGSIGMTFPDIVTAVGRRFKYSYTKKIRIYVRTCINNHEICAAGNGKSGPTFVFSMDKSLPTAEKREQALKSWDDDVTQYRANEDLRSSWGRSVDAEDVALIASSEKSAKQEEKAAKSVEKEEGVMLQQEKTMDNWKEQILSVLEAHDQVLHLIRRCRFGLVTQDDTMERITAILLQNSSELEQSAMEKRNA